MLGVHYHLREPCSYSNLTPKPHSLIHFPLHSQTSKFLEEGNDACYVGFFPNRYSKLFLPSVELVGQKASLLHSWRSKKREICSPLAVQPKGGRLAEYLTYGHVLRGEKHIRLLLTSGGDCGCWSPMEISPKALGRNGKDINKAVVTSYIAEISG